MSAQRGMIIIFHILIMMHAGYEMTTRTESIHYVLDSTLGRFCSSWSGLCRRGRRHSISTPALHPLPQQLARVAANKGRSVKIFRLRGGSFTRWWIVERPFPPVEVVPLLISARCRVGIARLEAVALLRVVESRASFEVQHLVKV